MQTTTATKSAVPLASLVLSCTMLLGTLGWAVMLVLAGTRIPYDSQIWPWMGLGLILLTLFSLAVAGAALWARCDWCSITSLLVAILAVVGSVLDFGLLILVMVAMHPI